MEEGEDGNAAVDGRFLVKFWQLSKFTLNMGMGIAGAWKKSLLSLDYLIDG